MKEPQDRKVNQLKARFTDNEKEQIIAYCEEHEMTVSDFIRYACKTIFQEEKK